MGSGPEQKFSLFRVMYPSSIAFNVICKAISKVFNSSPPFSGLRFDFNTPETAGQGDVTVYPYHPRIKQRIRAGELIGYYWDDNYPRIGPALVLEFSTYPPLRPIRPDHWGGTTWTF